MLLALPKILDKFPEQSYTYRVITWAYSSVGSASVVFPIWCYSSFAPIRNWVLFRGLVAQLGVQALHSQSGVMAHLPPLEIGCFFVGS